MNYPFENQKNSVKGYNMTILLVYPIFKLFFFIIIEKKKMKF